MLGNRWLFSRLEPHEKPHQRHFCPWVSRQSSSQSSSPCSSPCFSVVPSEWNDPRVRWWPSDLVSVLLNFTWEPSRITQLAFVGKHGLFVWVKPLDRSCFYLSSPDLTHQTIRRGRKGHIFFPQAWFYLNMTSSDELILQGFLEKKMENLGHVYSFSSEELRRLFVCMPVVVSSAHKTHNHTLLISHKSGRLIQRKLYSLAASLLHSIERFSLTHRWKRNATFSKKSSHAHVGKKKKVLFVW